MKKILILGGGFGGVYFANKLKKKKSTSFEIQLISNNNYFVFQPLLPEVASGALNASDAVVPLRELLNGIKIRIAEIFQINLIKQRVLVLQGFRKRSHWIDYDHLIIALGQESNLDHIDGLKEHAFTIRNLKDAYNIRNHILSCLELADVTKDEKLKRGLLNFSVIGGGFSGVETIGEVKEMVDKVLPFYPNLKLSEINFYLVEYSKRILPELPVDLGQYTMKIFLKNNINVLCETELKKVTGTNIYLNDSKIINTHTVISTIGSSVSEVIRKSEIKLNNGKIVTNENLQVEKYSNVWAIGDCAQTLNKNLKSEINYSPPTAQFAVRQSHLLAKNIFAFENRKRLESFSYKSRGSLASLGSRTGIGKVYGISIKGFFAWVIWRVFYLSFIPSFPTRLRIFFGWVLDFLVPRNAVMIESYKKKPISLLCYNKGDIVFEEGMLADGFYVVKEGSFRLKYQNTKDGKDFIKIYKKGEHFGARAILAGKRRTGNIVALKDSKVLKIDKESFILLHEDFPMLKKYLDKYLKANFKGLFLNETTKEN